MYALSQLQQVRLNYKPQLPNSLKNISQCHLESVFGKSLSPISSEIAPLFPHTNHLVPQKIVTGKLTDHLPLRVGVVLSGGQAPGGHNVISGLYDALKKLNANSTLFGFLDGPAGIINNKSIEITENLLGQYRNQGGFDIIGSGRTKIESPEQFAAAEATVSSMNLDGLVVIGGDDSNTNAALLAEYFTSHQCKTNVVGVPKTIDGDLKNGEVEISFGFDTATKTYSDIIGNIMRDALSAKKYYYFIKLMGRSASHITLECALQTHPNIALIAEEISDDKKNIDIIVSEICDIICSRAKQGKDFGVILIPEGVIEFILEFQILINELNALLSHEKQHHAKIEEIVSKDEKTKYISELLSINSKQCFQMIPSEIQTQMLIGRDPHGNVQVSKIETERLFIELVAFKLKDLKQKGIYKGSFNAQPLFCGYEGRSCLPSNFDCQYCYALGHVAALLIDSKATGFMSVIQDLTKSVDQWTAAAIPLTSLMNIELRHGQLKPVITKALVNLSSQPFLNFKKSRNDWALKDDYISPGPIQFFGPSQISDSITQTLSLEKGNQQ
ncbi:MAG: diphosphate--fructose-6-phosphate 1-phosphotransferase [Parachlamydiaceae bacterium]|nr:diphosphate--fructose-6-phosphate 1-phosphotransferase [Parachlamydiaceae bacterium]